MEDPLFCNSCWQAVPPGQPAVATACGHLFGFNCCASKTFSSFPAACTVCDTALPQSDVKKVTTQDDPTTVHFKLSLAAQPIAAALGATLAASQFETRQRDLYHAARLRQEEDKRAQVQANARKKLGEIAAAYKSLKRKYDEIKDLPAAIQELTQKYNARSMEAHQLKEANGGLHTKNDHLRRLVEEYAVRSGVNPASIPGLNTPAQAGIAGGSRAPITGLPHAGLSRRASLAPGPHAAATPFGDHGQALAPARAPSPRGHPSPVHSPAFTLGGGGGGFDYATPAHLAPPRGPGHNYAAAPPPGSGYHRTVPLHMAPHGGGGGGGGGMGAGDRRRASMFPGPGGGMPHDFGGRGGSLG